MSIKSEIITLNSQANSIEACLSDINKALNEKGAKPADKLSKIAELIKSIQTSSGESRWPFQGFKKGDRIYIHFSGYASNFIGSSNKGYVYIYDDRGTQLGTISAGNLIEDASSKGHLFPELGKIITVQNDTKYIDIKSPRLGLDYDKDSLYPPLLRINPACQVSEQNLNGECDFELYFKAAIADDLYITAWNGYGGQQLD